MRISYREKKIDVKVKRANGFGRFSGLMFRTQKTGNLLFEFSNSERSAIHSLFVFFPFLALWLDDKDKVIDFKIVKPFTLNSSSKKKPAKLMEIPLSQKNLPITKLFVDKKRFK